MRALAPRLRPHVQITRQLYRGRRWHVVHDPTRNFFYRLNPVGLDFVGLLDGQRTVDDAWKLVLAKHGDGAPTQGEVIELIGQLYSSNLLSIDVTPETEQLLSRGRTRAQRRVVQQAIGLMYFKLRLINPDRLLTLLEPIFRPILNRFGLVAWAGLVLTALLMVLGRWRELAAGFDDYILQASPTGFGWMIVVFVALKLWHEFGHGVLCKRFGGQVPEAGVFLMVLFPSPFVDASSCWALPNKWQRIAVAAGGMIFELAAASIAAFFWLSLPEGSPARAIAYYAMITSSITTLVFNANPLMKFDGYYILSDWLEIPNLYQRSTSMLTYWCARYIYRVPNPRSPSAVASERALLTVFGVLSLAYRVLLFLTITLYVMGLFFGVGLFLAVWSLGMWFLLPAGKFVHWLATSSQLYDKRSRAVLTTLALLTLTTIALGVVRIPDWRRATGVVESDARTTVFFKADGFVDQVHVLPGQSVRAGDPIATLSSPELGSAILATRASIEEARVRRREAQSSDDAPSVQVVDRQIELYAAQLVELETRRENLILRAPQDGVIVSADPNRLIGALVRRGQPACGIVDTTKLHIAASVTQADASMLFALSAKDYAVELRPISRPRESPILVDKVTPVDAGSRELVHAALGFSGGGDIATSASDQTGRTAQRGQFLVYLQSSDEHLAQLRPGERVRVRFTLPSRPLLSQFYERVQRLLQTKVNL